MDLVQMLDKITAYSDIMNKHNFHENGVGNLPWSHRHDKEDGTYVEISGNKWMLYDAEGDLLDVGTTPDELVLSLKLIYGNK